MLFTVSTSNLSERALTNFTPNPFVPTIDSDILSLSKFDPALRTDTAVSILLSPLFLFIVDPFVNPSPVSVMDTIFLSLSISTVIVFIGVDILFASSTELENTSSNNLYIPIECSLFIALMCPSPIMGNVSSLFLTEPTYMVGLFIICSNSVSTSIFLLTLLIFYIIKPGRSGQSYMTGSAKVSTKNPNILKILGFKIFKDLN